MLVLLNKERYDLTFSHQMSSNKLTPATVSNLSVTTPNREEKTQDMRVEIQFYIKRLALLKEA